MTLDPGTSLGSYEVLGPLGAGGMGEVYRALDRRLGREVAIKILPEAFASDPARLARFEREARMLASVNHPALASIYGLEEAGPTRYIVMELVPGETLDETLCRGPLPLREALRIARQIAEGLEAAHEKTIVHRDLKPANIKITPEGRVKVLDLGLAKAMEPPVERASFSESPTVRLDATRPGVIVGTIEFMSPEQARGKLVDKRTDVWAFGCVLFEMLSGRRVFSGETPSDLIAAILTEEPRWRLLPPGTPPRVRELLERCLQKDANNRLRDIGDARLALDDALAESAERRPVAPSARSDVRERRIVVATVAGLLIAGAGWLLLRSRPANARVPTSKYLAVLPFRNLSELPGGQLVGDGLVETVSVRLAGVPGVQVVTPAAAVAAFDRQGDPFRVARDLGANLVLRGAIQSQGDRVRITYSVWNTQTRVQVAGGDLTGPAADLFGIQDQLADRVALELHLTPMARTPPPPSGLPAVSQQERYLQAIGYLQRFDKPDAVDGAIRLLTLLASEAPGSPLVHAALSRSYLHKFVLTHERDWAVRALAESDRAMELDPSMPDVKITRGQILAKTGRAVQAISEFQGALAQQPNSAEALQGLGDAYQDLGRKSEAESAYRRAIALEPASWAVYNRLGFFFFRIGRYPSAAEMFQRATQLAPDSVRAWNNLGAAYQSMDHLEDARNAYEHSAQLQPNDGAYSNLGTLQFYLGRFREASESFEKAARMTPGKALYWANLGDAYRWTPELRAKSVAAYARAIALAREQLETDPRDGSALATLGVCLAKTGKPAEGLDRLRAALALEPGNPDFLYDAAVVSNLLGRTDDAVGWLRQAVGAGLPVAQIRTEPEFEGLRKTPAFQKIFPPAKAAA